MDCTFDEVLAAYKGKVDEWRLHRNGYYLIHRSLVQKPVDILAEIPLPFDNLLRQQLKESEKEFEKDMIADYQKYVESGYFKSLEVGRA